MYIENGVEVKHNVVLLNFLGSQVGSWVDYKTFNSSINDFLTFDKCEKITEDVSFLTYRWTKEHSILKTQGEELEKINSNLTLKMREQFKEAKIIEFACDFLLQFDVNQFGDLGKITYSKIYRS